MIQCVSNKNFEAKLHLLCVVDQVIGFYSQGKSFITLGCDLKWSQSHSYEKS